MRNLNIKRYLTIIENCLSRKKKKISQRRIWSFDKIWPSDKWETNGRANSCIQIYRQVSSFQPRPHLSSLVQWFGRQVIATKGCRTTRYLTQRFDSWETLQKSTHSRSGQTDVFLPFSLALGKDFDQVRSDPWIIKIGWKLPVWPFFKAYIQGRQTLG